MSVEEIGINDSEGNQYQPSSDFLYFVLRKLKPTSDDCIIDIGCGKGRAMWVMSKFSFYKIRGYDISKDLVRIANDNFVKLKLKQCFAEYGDASEYSDYDDCNYFYLSNPVPTPVMEVLLNNIYNSLERKPRNAVLVYMNPISHELIQRGGYFHLEYKQNHLIKWYRFYIYRHEI